MYTATCERSRKKWVFKMITYHHGKSRFPNLMCISVIVENKMIQEKPLPCMSMLSCVAVFQYITIF